MHQFIDGRCIHRVLVSGLNSKLKSSLATENKAIGTYILDDVQLHLQFKS